MLLTYPVENLEKWQLAYIAGIIDGEGCITLALSHKIINVGKVPSPIVLVTMTNLDCVTTLHKITGVGRFTIIHGKRADSFQHKTAYRWNVRQRLEVYVLLKSICPYLVVKKRQADVVLEFVKRRMQDISIEEQDFELLRKVQKLNK